MNVDLRARGAAPDHVLLEHAAAVEKLAGRVFAVALHDEADVRARKCVGVVAEERAGAVIRNANEAAQVDDENGVLHRLENRSGRVFRRDVGELMAPDRGGGDDRECEHRDVTDRTDADAERRQIVGHRQRAERKRDDQHRRAFTRAW